MKTKQKRKKGKRIYVAGKVGKSTQVHRKGSNRCFCRRLLSPHSDRTADYSHCSCCSVHRHILKTGQVSPVTQNRILNSASLLVYWFILLLVYFISFLFLKCHSYILTIYDYSLREFWIALISLDPISLWRTTCRWLSVITWVLGYSHWQQTQLECTCWSCVLPGPEESTFFRLTQKIWR